MDSIITLDEGALRRLAVIKFLRDQGVAQSRPLSPTAGLGLLPLHDAVEMLLQLTAEYLHIATKNIPFTAYWAELAKSDVALGRKGQMERFNLARVALKHSGSLPHRDDLVRHVSNAVAFIDDCMEAVYGRSIEEISLSDLVTDEEIRGHLSQSQQLLASGAHEASMTEATMAFIKAMRAYYQSPAGEDGVAPYSIQGASTPFHSIFDASTLADHFTGHDRFTARRTFESIGRTAQVVDEALLIVGCGLDFRAYQHFRALMPVVHEMVGGDIVVDWMRPAPTDKAQVHRFLDFATEAALRLGSP